MLQYHPLNVQSKASLSSSRRVVQSCGVSFANWLYLVPLIISQNFCATHATINQTGPGLPALPKFRAQQPFADRRLGVGPRERRRGAAGERGRRRGR